MNRTNPNFLQDVCVSTEYYTIPDSYVNVLSCHADLLELSRYAKEKAKSQSISENGGSGKGVWAVLRE